MFGLTTTRRLKRELAHQQRGYHLLLKQAAEKNRDALAAVATELSRMKDIVALHIVAASHPSTVLHDPQRIGEALREELAANDVDLRLELARLEGGAL